MLCFFIYYLTTFVSGRCTKCNGGFWRPARFWRVSGEGAHFQPLYNVQRWAPAARPPLVGWTPTPLASLASLAVVQRTTAGLHDPLASGEPVAKGIASSRCTTYNGGLLQPVRLWWVGYPPLRHPWPLWPLYNVQRWVLAARPPLAGWNLVRVSPFSHSFPLWPLYNVRRWVLVTRSLLGSRWGGYSFPAVVQCTTMGTCGPPASGRVRNR